MIIRAVKKTSELDRIYKKIKNFCTNENISISSNINLILDEVFSNIIKYSGTNQTHNKVTISLEKYSKSIEIQIIYHGVYFDILKYTKTPLDIFLGRVGIPIIKSFANKIFYKNRKNCNMLTFFLLLDDII